MSPIQSNNGKGFLNLFTTIPFVLENESVLICHFRWSQVPKMFPGCSFLSNVHSNLTEKSLKIAFEGSKVARIDWQMAGNLIGSPVKESKFSLGPTIVFILPNTEIQLLHSFEASKKGEQRLGRCFKWEIFGETSAVQTTCEEILQTTSL